MDSSLIRILGMWCMASKTEAGSLRSGHPPLALQPGKPNRLPTSGGASMPLVIERPFKAAGDVVTGTVTHCCHSLGRGQTSSSERQMKKRSSSSFTPSALSSPARRSAKRGSTV